MSISSSSFSIPDSSPNTAAPVVDFASRALTSLVKLCNRVLAFTASAFDSFPQSYDEDELEQHKSIVQLFNDLLDAVEPGVTITINHNASSSSLSPNTTLTMDGIDMDMSNHINKPISVSEIVTDPSGNQTITTVQHLNVSISHNNLIGDGSKDRHPDIMNYRNVSRPHHSNSENTLNGSISSLEQTSDPVDHNLSIVISNVTVVSSTNGRNDHTNVSTSTTDEHNVTVADIGVVRQGFSDVNTTSTISDVDQANDTLVSPTAPSATEKTLAAVMSDAMSTIANDSSVVIKQQIAFTDSEEAKNLSSQTTSAFENKDKLITVTEIMNQTGSLPSSNNDSIQSQQENSLTVDAAIEKELKQIASILTANDTLKGVDVTETNTTDVHNNQTEIIDNHMVPIDHPRERNGSVETQDNQDNGNKTMNVDVSVVPSTQNQHVNDSALGTIAINTTASEPEMLNHNLVNQTNFTVAQDVNMTDMNKTMGVTIPIVLEKESEGLLNGAESSKNGKNNTIVESQPNVNVSELSAIPEANINQAATSDAPNVTLSAPVVLKEENGPMVNTEANLTQTQSMSESNSTIDNRNGTEHLNIGNLTIVGMPNAIESQPNASTAQQETTNLPTNQTVTVVHHIEATGDQTESTLTSQQVAPRKQQETTHVPINQTQPVVDHIKVTGNQTGPLLPSFKNHTKIINTSTMAASNRDDLSLVPNSTVRSAVDNSGDAFAGDDGEEDEGEVDPESPPSKSLTTSTQNHQFNLNPMRPLETESPSNPSIPTNDNPVQSHDHSDFNRPSAIVHTGEMGSQVQKQSPMHQQDVRQQEKETKVAPELPKHADRQTYVMRPMEPRNNALNNDEQGQQTQQDNVPGHDDIHHPPLQHRQMSKDSIDGKPRHDDPRYEQAREYARNFEQMHLYDKKVHPDEVNQKTIGQGPLNGPQNQMYEHPQGPQNEARVHMHDDYAGHSGLQNVNDQSQFPQQINHEHEQEQSIRDRDMNINGPQNQAYDQAHAAQNDARAHEHGQYPTGENAAADYHARKNANDRSHVTHQDDHEHRREQSYQDHNADSKYMGELIGTVEGNSIAETEHLNKGEGQTEAIHDKRQYKGKDSGPNTPSVGNVKDMDMRQTEDESSTNERHAFKESHGDNITQLAMMVYKIARAEQVNSIAAVPCQPVKLWLPGVLNKLQAWNPSLEFFCVDTSDDPEDRLQDLRVAFASFPKSVFIKTSVGELNEEMPRGVDLVVSWMGIQQWGVRNGWKFFKNLKRSGAKLCLLSNNAVRRNPDDTVPAAILNVRKPPLLFKEPSRLIRKVHRRDDSLQLLLYDMNKLRDDF